MTSLRRKHYISGISSHLNLFRWYGYGIFTHAVSVLSDHQIMIIKTITFIRDKYAYDANAASCL